MAQYPTLRLLPLVAAMALTPPAFAAPGSDLVKDSLPQKWIDDLLPEDLPEQKHPGYFNDVDKARAQAFAGRYKQALHTLARA